MVHTRLQKMGFTLVLSAFTLALLLPFLTYSAAASAVLQAFGSDTVAGYEAVLSTSKTTPNRDVLLTVTKPSGQIVTISATTNASGVAVLSLYDYHTRKAGVYTVAARFVGADGSANAVGSGGATSFVVYPDEVSFQDSTVTADRTLVRSDGKDAARVAVVLKDQYGNPFQGHSVNLISSRPEDTITSLGASATGSFTDETGTAVFTVSSVKGGVSTFSALDSTSGKVLEARAQVAFVKDASALGLAGTAGSLADAGGDLLAFAPFIPTASAQVSGSVSQFELSGIPASVAANQNVSFRITAQDQSGVTVENYTGTVHFSVLGDNSLNVTLPEDFTFKAENLGTHQFSLGLRFPSAGTYTITATDVSNQLVTGETVVVVGSAGSGTGSDSTGTGDRPVVTAPLPGITSQNVQTITGRVAPGKDLTILDNGVDIGTALATSSGTFSFTTSPLAEGDHTFEVEAIALSGQTEATSLPVTITVDTRAPLLEDIQVSPASGITPGQLLTITLYSNEPLYESALIFENDIFELTASSAGQRMYSASINAPLEEGAYTLDAVLVDELGNEETYTGAATITVANDGSGSASGNGAGGTPPSQVFGVVAYGSAERVTLLWEAASDDTQVEHYRIRYGTDPDLLDKTVDTMDAATSWYIPGLVNGSEYFFMVFAVDEDENESLTGSELITGIPFSLEVESELGDRPDGALSTAGEDNALLRGAAFPETLSDQGPELLWLLGGSGFATALLRRKK